MKSSNLKLLGLVGPGLIAVPGDAGASKGYRPQQAAAHWTGRPQPWELGPNGRALWAVWQLRLPGDAHWHEIVVPRAACQ
jgi:hypothetical protein